MQSIKHAELIKKYLGLAIEHTNMDTEEVEEQDENDSEEVEERDSIERDDEEESRSERLIRSNWYNQDYSLRSSSWYDDREVQVPENINLESDEVPDSFIEYYNSRRELR